MNEEVLREFATVSHNTIEPYIRTIHFVHNREGMDSSIVGLSVEEYLSEKLGRRDDRVLEGV